MVGRKRIRLSQKKSLKRDGYRDIWVLAPEVEFVRDLEQYVEELLKWTSPLEFELSGASIPSSEAAEIIRDGDTLEVVRKGPSLDGSIEHAQRTRPAFAQQDQKAESSSGSLESSSTELVNIRSSSNANSPSSSSSSSSSASPSVSSSEQPKNEEVPIQTTPSPPAGETPKGAGTEEEPGQSVIPKLSSSAKRRIRRKRIREIQRSQQGGAPQTQPAFENSREAMKGTNAEIGELASPAKPASENSGREIVNRTTGLEGHQTDEAASKMTTKRSQRTFIPSGSISGVLKRIQ
mmetsp:Transcript_28056/g.110315  ORF Transcript_28056/g.110315 Transcript_28056/m.110315 type:complete len:292 (-) Transcript_28056:2845-3720(-)